MRLFQLHPRHLDRMSPLELEPFLDRREAIVAEERKAARELAALRRKAQRGR